LYLKSTEAVKNDTGRFAFPQAVCQARLPLPDFHRLARRNTGKPCGMLTFCLRLRHLLSFQLVALAQPALPADCRQRKALPRSSNLNRSLKSGLFRSGDSQARTGAQSLAQAAAVCYKISRSGAQQEHNRRGKMERAIRWNMLAGCLLAALLCPAAGWTKANSPAGAAFTPPTAHPSAAVVLSEQAGRLKAQGRLDEAEKLYLQALAVWTASVESPACRRALLATC
jgi:hypothetical protein